MSMEAAASRRHAEPLRATPLRPAGDPDRKPRPGPGGQAAGRRVLPGGRVALSLPGQRDRLRHGQGRADRPEDHGHAGLDRHAQPLPAPGRGGPRRPGPRPSRRRDADPLAERRDGGDRAAAALAGRVGRADRGHHRPGRQHAGPRGHGRRSSSARWKRPARWAWPPAPAPRPCWPWATPWRWWSARCGVSAARISPASIRPAAWATS